MSLQNIQRHYLRLLRLWPIDHLRGVTFHDALRKRLEARFLRPANPPQTSPGTTIAPAEPVETKVDAGKESEQLNVLYSLMENRYSKKYACSDRLLRPQFNPTYYEELAHEMEEAPKRSWLQQKWLRLSQVVRFS